MPGNDVEVVDNAEKHRWEARLGGELAGTLRYGLHRGRVVLVHTEVDPAFEGHGVGSALARAALEAARSRGERVLVSCPFVASYVRRHPEVRESAELVVR